MATRTSTSQLRPVTPKTTSDTQSSHSQHPEQDESVPPLPLPRSSTSSTNPSSRRSALSFLRRSKSGDPVKKMPVVAPTAPKLPDLIPNGGGYSSSDDTTEFPTHFLDGNMRDSVAIATGNIHEDDQERHYEHVNNGNLSPPTNYNGGYVPGRKSTDSVIGPSGQYISSSSLPITEDPYAAIGSMAHRGRYSYASTAGGASTVNSPRRVRRRKDPTPFNILVIGAKNSGKTSFLRFLRQSLALKKRGQAIPEEASAPPVITAQGEFTGSYTETEIDGERIGLTLWDSAGLEKNVVDLQIRELVAFVEAKFEETFAEENKVVRAPGIRDTHIHCVFLLLDPARLTPNNHYFGKTGSNATELGGLDQGLDISVFKALRGKTVVVPVISKADTCTSKHMEHLKEIVRSGLAKAGEDPLVSLDLEIEGEGNDDERDTRSASPRRGKRSSLPEVEEDEDDDDEKLEDGETDKPKPPPKELPITPGLTFIPLTIISPDSYEPGEKVGRAFPWGFADPYDENHCDFKRLKYSVFSEWRAELREKSRESWYEHWRSERLGSTGGRRRRV
ncbi:Septin-domain-containing protein [Pyronema domesticum]|uniref:Similar to Septin-2 acc. no. Q5ZMH1 n=1 Tax=Pyronema omphalodes (strain CBS 100304) TaxID=1076935 RepID=U4LRD7_PYROM|nr:Septin-domain-containing protein [Pyronema domesticum]CCX29841.1 Similar to Septin-2; acc. no. Q5ZMH1 [Pyronema omphalodes CBS 100304]